MRFLLSDILRILRKCLIVSAILSVLLCLFVVLTEGGDTEPVTVVIVFAALTVILCAVLAVIPLAVYALWRLLCRIRHEDDPDFDDFKDVLYTIPSLLLSLVFDLLPLLFEGSGDSGSDSRSPHHSSGSGHHSSGSFGRSGGSRGSGTSRKF